MIAALPWSEVAVSHNVSSEKSSLSVSFPMPGFISAVAVKVGKTSCVDVAEGGNQTIVSVGMGVSVGTAVSVGRGALNGRQAANNSVIASHIGAKQSLRK